MAFLYSFNLKMLSSPDKNAATAASTLNSLTSSHCLQLVVATLSWSFCVVFQSSLEQLLLALIPPDSLYKKVIESTEVLRPFENAVY